MENDVIEFWETLATTAVSPEKTATESLVGANVTESTPLSSPPAYATVLVLNEQRQVLVRDRGSKKSGYGSWHILCEQIEVDGNPLLVVKQLLKQIGYRTTDWIYLGTFVTQTDPNVGAGYFFVAQAAQPVTAPLQQTPALDSLRWVSVADLKTAVLDGRIADMHHAMTVTLAMLTVLSE